MRSPSCGPLLDASRDLWEGADRDDSKRKRAIRSNRNTVVVALTPLRRLPGSSVKSSKAVSSEAAFLLWMREAERGSDGTRLQESPDD
jgi:hypothetical protein